MIRSADESLRMKLSQAGLPEDPAELIGTKFRFEWREDFMEYWHEEVIYGTIHSLSYGDSDTLYLYVSTPRFREKKLIQLTYSHKTWVALIKSTAPREFEGDLTIL